MFHFYLKGVVQITHFGIVSEISFQLMANLQISTFLYCIIFNYIPFSGYTAICTRKKISRTGIGTYTSVILPIVTHGVKNAATTNANMTSLRKAKRNIVQMMAKAKNGEQTSRGNNHHNAISRTLPNELGRPYR